MFFKYLCALLTFWSHLLLAVNSPLNSISKSDLNYLSRFFYAYFINEDFSYTLLGDKPMSFSGICNYNKETGQIFSLKDHSQLSLAQAFEIFKKWRDHFINKNYGFVLNEDLDGVTIYFINKKAFMSVINENIDIFMKELGEEFSSVSFLKEIEEEKKPLLEIIHHHEGILGILLGYGRHNSMLFQKKADILGRCWAYECRKKQQNGPFESFYGFTSLQEELEYLDSKLTCFSEEHEYRTFVPVSPLGFAADQNHPETKKLKEKYASTQQKINQIYTRANPIEVILSLLLRSE